MGIATHCCPRSARLIRILFIVLAMLAMPVQAKPNIVLILTDDFSMNLMPGNSGMDGSYMPHLTKMMADGLVFDNFFVTDSLCCPSRASIFTGLLPHNTGVLTNGAPDGGLYAFDLHGDAQKTFVLPLQAAGYQTSFAGKYLNGYDEAVSDIPPGWTDWVSTSNGYPGYGYVLNHNGVLSTPADHFTDTISELGRAFMAQAIQPFFLELASFSPHKPYTPPTRYNGAFLNAVVPRTPAYNARPDANAPDWLQIMPPVKVHAQREYDAIFRLRLQGSQGVDDMIGDVRAQLETLGIADNTYVIFTSDNGYHMGEYSLRPGKMTPFDTDIHVPFVVVGPGVPAGTHTSALAMNIDLYPTFLALAGAPPSADVDGHSLANLFQGRIAAARSVALIEHTQPVYDPNDPDASEPKAGDPPTYTALRMAHSMYVEYVTGEVGYYYLKRDPYELHNTVAKLTPAHLAALHTALVANRDCVGAVQCAAAQALMR